MIDVLDLIDQTLHDTAVSDDAMRWIPVPPDCEPAPIMRHYRVLNPPPRQLTTEERAELTRQRIAALDRAAQAFVDGIEAALAPCIRHLADAEQRLWEAWLIEPPHVSVDPRERALAARRNRNTGPKVRPRAPRRIDPRGAR